MKKSRLKLFVLFLINLFLFSSCEMPSNSSPTDLSTGPIVEYEKDENGFYILEQKDFYHELSSDGKSQIQYAQIPEGIEESTNLRLYEQGNQIPLYKVKTNTSQNWNAKAPSRTDNSVAIISKKGSVTLTLQANFSLKYGVSISPLEKKVESFVDENKRTVTFTIKSSGQYTIEFRTNKTLHLFVDDIGIYDDIKKDPNIIYLGPGIHNKQNNSKINNNNNFTIYSNQTIFLDYGAVLQGSFVSNNASNIKIIGGGVIDGAGFVRDADTGERQIPIDFNYCTNVEISGITTLDPAGWTYNIYFNKNVSIDNIKIISSRSNGDGISLQSCQDVEVNNCFVRSWDDSLVVKNYPQWSNRNNQGTTLNIKFSNCILWTDLAQSMEIGFETVGEVMENITFENITVIHNFHKPAISIHNGNNANIKNVTFKNIIIEDAAMGKGDGTNIVIEFSTEFSPIWSTNHATTSLGSIDGVTLENIQIKTTRDDLKINMTGCVDTREGYNNSIHKISNVIFKNVYLNDKKIDSSYEGLNVNQYVENLSFE